jgi:multidrug efflux pump subunit AcrA (membrane-fusion protein)
MQPIIGLQTFTLQPAQVSPELKAYGHVLDPSPLASIVADLITAEAAGQASAAELARLKTLAPQGNASERAVQNAQAAAVHDQAQIQAIRLRLLAGWGSGISQRTDLPDFIQSLGSLSSAIVELEVPAGETFTGSPTGARLFTLGDQTNAVAAQLIGPAPNVDPQMQGRGFLLLVSPNPLRLAPGAAVTGLLSLPGDPRTGVLLPREAVVWFNGLTWTYLQVSGDSFQREQVTLDTPLDNGWFVASGLKAQDKVVTTGGQQLLSEELKGQLSGD